MMQPVQTTTFRKEVACTYRGDNYRVRDNGSVFRCLRAGKGRRPLDETWTLGRPSNSDGYMALSDQKIHRVVATAFHGAQPTEQHVVDHIDTNRRNNRPENLRWVTRLENILLNPITAKRVEYLYGSIEQFLSDPSTPVNGTLSEDFGWMRTVTPDEAEYSRKRLMAWAHSDRPSGAGSLGDWIFGTKTDITEETPDPLVASKTPGAIQKNWRVPAEFPACPETSSRNPIEAYNERLKLGDVFAISPYGHSTIEKLALSADNTALFILGWHGEDAIKKWSLAQVTFEGGNFVHQSCGTFFTPEGAEKEFTLIQGLPWARGDTFDDFC